MRNILIGFGAAIACIGIVAVIWLQSEIISVQTDPPRQLDTPSRQIALEPSISEVRRVLLAAGLNEQPILGDTGVDAHIARLESGAISAVALLAYADGLSEISRITTEFGAEIPSAFWDVQTPALTRDGWTPMAIVSHLTDEQGRPYLDLLGKAYARFHVFRTGTHSKDTALAASFDILDLAHDYILALPPERRLQHGPKLQSVEAATLMAWQTLVAGTTRQIPGLRRPAFDHGFVGRFSVKTIYQYDVETPMSVGRVWGTSGFKQRFVGPPANDNQIEHLAISSLLQIAAHTPVSALDALELERAATGGSSLGEAQADIALNKAIHSYFVPEIYEDFETAKLRLQSELSE